MAIQCYWNGISNFKQTQSRAYGETGNSNSKARHVQNQPAKHCHMKNEEGTSGAKI